MSVDVPNSAQCRGCGYSLRGLPEPRCPECGKTFSPDDPETYNDPSRPKRRRHRPPKPPRSLYVVLLVQLVLVVVILRGSVWALVGWGVLLTPVGRVSTIVVLVIILDYWRRFSGLRTARTIGDVKVTEEFSRHRRRWRVQTVCVILLTSLLVYPWPMCIRFWVSLPVFSRVANEYLDGSRSGTGPCRVGLWQVEEVFYGYYGVFFQVGRGYDEGGSARVGFAYRTHALAPERPGYRVSASWYAEAW